jgi:hypothetical protein
LPACAEPHKRSPPPSTNSPRSSEPPRPRQARAIAAPVRAATGRPAHTPPLHSVRGAQCSARRSRRTPARSTDRDPGVRAEPTPAPHSIAFGSIVGDPRPHRGERVGKALGVPAPIHQRTSQKRVSRSEPLGRRFVIRGKPAVAQPRHPSEPSVRAPASDPQRDAARLDGPRRQLIKPDPGSLQWPSSIPSIRVPRACCGRVASASASSPQRQSQPHCRSSHTEQSPCWRGRFRRDALRLSSWESVAAHSTRDAPNAGEAAAAGDR